MNINLQSAKINMTSNNSGQILLVSPASGMYLNKVISGLNEITPCLPYS